LIPYVEDVARRLAREGYLALAPDLYTGDSIRAVLNVEELEEATALGRASDVDAATAALPAERRERVRAAHDWRQARTGEKYIPFLQGTLRYLQGRSDVMPGAVGAIGFCMGGRLSATLATTGAELAGAVVFYGPNPPLNNVANVRCPVQGHYGGDDPSVTLKVPDLDAAMKAAGKGFTYFVYEGAPHAFHNDTRPDYHAEASRLSWGRAVEFLATHVKGAAVLAR
jgi:carboxymethylenebutenolidase